MGRIPVWNEQASTFSDFVEDAYSEFYKTTKQLFGRVHALNRNMRVATSSMRRHSDMLDEGVFERAKTISRAISGTETALNNLNHRRLIDSIGPGRRVAAGL